MKVPRSQSLSYARSFTHAAGLGALLLMSSATAQYVFEEPVHDADKIGVRYFGFAKDPKGARLENVTILLESGPSSFIFVTDANGRFRGTLPLELPANAVTPTCSKEGHISVRTTKRPGPKSARPTVQIDCILRPVA